MSSYDLREIERLYRANVLSGRDIARTAGMSEAYLRKLVKKHGWKRNLTREIREATQAALAHDAVPDKPAPLTDEEIVAHGAQVRAAIVTTHREGVGKAREIVRRLLAELDETTGNIGSIEKAILEHEPGDSDRSRRRQEAMLQAVSLANRAGVADKLVSALDRLIRVERQSYNIDDTDTSESYEDRLRRLMDEGS